MALKCIHHHFHIMIPQVEESNKTAGCLKTKLIWVEGLILMERGNLWC